jgi:uncharacterized damage-inducible protein DinB
MMLEHLRRMARYNRWANRRLYAACAALAPAAYLAARPAFFGSIHGTLCHLLVADRIWLARIEGVAPPYRRLDEQPCATLAALAAAREAEDERIIALVDGYAREAVGQVLRYRTVTQPLVEIETPLHLCWLHLFNHQPHHRGQIHDQLSQTEIPPAAARPDLLPARGRVSAVCAGRGARPSERRRRRR